MAPHSLRSAVLLYPHNIAVHPVLKKLPAALADVAAFVEQAFLCLYEGFRLPKRWHVQIRKHVTQVLLRHRRADCADGDADDARGLSGPGALAIRA